jgi:hypothetical protein
MPVPAAELGGAAAKLPLAQDSGPQSNADAASQANGHITAGQLTRIGRLTGYMLDYGTPAFAGNVLVIQTNVELYKSPAAAKKGVALWAKDATDLKVLKRIPGLTPTASLVGAPAFGAEAFEAGGILKAAGKATVYYDGFEFRRGTVVGAASALAGTKAAAASLARAAAQRLSARIHQVLAGRIGGSAPALPKVKAGPPAHGPAPARLALTPDDFGGGKVSKQGYRTDTDLGPISEYSRTFTPAGPFPYVQEQVILFATPGQASFVATVLRGAGTAASVDALAKGTNFHATSVPVHGGDEAYATDGQIDYPDGKAAFLAFVIVRVGPSVEFVSLAAPPSTPLTALQMQALVTAIAGSAHTGLK